MKKWLFLQPKLVVAMVCLLNMACQEPGGQLNTGDGVRSGADAMAGRTEHDSTKAVPISDLAEATGPTAATWQDSLILHYIQNTDNELVRQLRSDKVELLWLFDRVEPTDTATYYIYNLGNTVRDESDGPRWAVIQWLYIDSLQRRLYEYDVAQEKIRDWTPIPEK